MKNIKKYNEHSLTEDEYLNKVYPVLSDTDVSTIIDLFLDISEEYGLTDKGIVKPGYSLDEKNCWSSIVSFANVKSVQGSSVVINVYKDYINRNNQFISDIKDYIKRLKLFGYDVTSHLFPNSGNLRIHVSKLIE